MPSRRLRHIFNPLSAATVPEASQARPSDQSSPSAFLFALSVAKNSSRLSAGPSQIALMGSFQSLHEHTVKALQVHDPMIRVDVSLD
jgi:hypothetical protein